jgi:hypothetical protein
MLLHLLRVERALGRLAARVADLPGGAADQQQRFMAAELEAAGGDELHEVADVQRGRGRVEADIERDRRVVERFAQLAGVGRVLDQAAPHEVVYESHAAIVPHPAVRQTPGFAMLYP